MRGARHGVALLVAGPGSDLSDEPAMGIEPAALDFVAAPNVSALLARGVTARPEPASRHRQERRGEGADQFRALPRAWPLLRPCSWLVRRGRRGLWDGPGRGVVAPGKEHDAWLAASSCPERAIEVLQES